MLLFWLARSSLHILCVTKYHFTLSLTPLYPSVPLCTQPSFCLHGWIDGSEQSELGLQSRAKLGTFLEGAHSLWDELKVQGHCEQSLISLFSCSSSKWMSFQVRGTSLPRALQCWDRSLEANRNNKAPAKGCPFHLVDTCQWPQCNPTCPALVDPVTQQELTLLQMLVAIGLDLQKLGLDPQRDTDSLASMVIGGG